MQPPSRHKAYRPGDQINISVTREFAPVATEFFRFCEAHHFNPSDVVRGAISAWLAEARRRYGGMDAEPAAQPRKRPGRMRGGAEDIFSTVFEQEAGE